MPELLTTAPGLSVAESARLKAVAAVFSSPGLGPKCRLRR